MDLQLSEHLTEWFNAVHRTGKWVKLECFLQHAQLTVDIQLYKQIYCYWPWSGQCAPNLSCEKEGSPGIWSHSERCRVKKCRRYGIWTHVLSSKWYFWYITHFRALYGHDLSSLCFLLLVHFPFNVQINDSHTYFMIIQDYPSPDITQVCKCHCACGRRWKVHKN